MSEVRRTTGRDGADRTEDVRRTKTKKAVGRTEESRQVKTQKATERTDGARQDSGNRTEAQIKEEMEMRKAAKKAWRFKIHAEAVERDFEEMHIHKICTQMIEAVLPELYEIRADQEARLGRPVVQYINSRVKTPASIANKLVRKRRKVTMEKAMETFNDLAGIRIVCSFQDDVYRVKRAVEKLPGIAVEKVKDYIAHPKPTGYRSIHVVARVRDFENGELSPVRMEIQICSAAMNYWAMLEHQLSYKNSHISREDYEKIQEKLKSYAVDIADIDKRFLRIRKKIEKL